MERLLTGTAAVSLLAFAGPALAQNQDQTQSAQDQGQAEVIDMQTIALGDWNYDQVYQKGSWTAEQVLDADVIGPDGDEIGEVENIIVGTEGKVEAIIAEVGGFWDMGDTHVRVPWNEIETRFEGDDVQVHVPITQDTVENYGLYGDEAGIRVVDDDDPETPRGWRVTELIHDYVTLEGGERYGWMEDLVFDDQGQLQAVVVDSTYGAVPGRYAYPYYGYGYGFAPGSPYYRMPYGAEDLHEMESFDYDRLAELAGQ